MRYISNPLLKNKLFRGTALAALICDTLLLLPFFFTSNLFVKILPSGNVWSLAVLLIFSVMSLSLSKHYERLRTAGLIKIQRKTLIYFKNIEVSLLFSGQPQGASQQVLLSVLLSLKTNEFVSAATGALQIFFPIIVFGITFAVSIPLFFLLLIFLVMYGYVFSSFQSSGANSGLARLNTQSLLKRISFYYWMGRVKTRLLLNKRQNGNVSIFRQMLDASDLGNFRYSASLLLLAACAFLIIEESLPVGYLLPISFFSQRLLVPAEKYKQLRMIWSVFKIYGAHESLGKPLSKEKQAEDFGVDAIGFVAPVLFEDIDTDFRLSLQQSVLVKNGELLVITGGAGFGKSRLLDLILGLAPLKSGRIHLSSKSKTPWEFIRYFDQRDVFFKPDQELSFYTERLTALNNFFIEPERCVLIIDDPLLGADAKLREHVIALFSSALKGGAIIVVACNDKQLVDMSTAWLAVAQDGEVAVRKAPPTN
jgi:ABC-type transport system involved in cytochrome c biogenesis ATPase subunit